MANHRRKGLHTDEVNFSVMYITTKRNQRLKAPFSEGNSKLNLLTPNILGEIVTTVAHAYHRYVCLAKEGVRHQILMVPYWFKNVSENFGVVFMKNEPGKN